MTIPETLRALSAVQAGIAAEYAEMPMKAVIHEQYQAACDAGAQCVEVVQSHRDVLAHIEQLEAHRHGMAVPEDECVSCQTLKFLYRDLGKSFYRAARSILHGSPQQ